MTLYGKKIGINSSQLEVYKEYQDTRGFHRVITFVTMVLPEGGLELTTLRFVKCSMIISQYLNDYGVLSC